MSTEEKKIRLIRYLEGDLSISEKGNLQKELDRDSVLQKEYQELKDLLDVLENQEEATPDPSLKIGFLEMLEREKSLPENREIKKSVTKYIFPFWFSLAAAVSLLVISSFAGIWIKKSVDQQKEIQALREEIHATRQLLLIALSDQQASTRLQAVSNIHDLPMDRELVNTLIRVVKEDSNLNVKLSALEALGPISHDLLVKDALLELVTLQHEPMLQVYVIQLLTRISDERSVGALQELLENKSTSEIVQEEAQLALFRMNQTMI